MSDYLKDISMTKTAITALKGQAQYDFLIDYFKSIREESYKKGCKDTEDKIMKILYRNKVFDIDSIKKELSGEKP